MPAKLVDTPAEEDLRFQGYRLEVVSHWPASPRRLAAIEAISQRLTGIGRAALVRPDISDLLHLTCQLLDSFFAAAEPPLPPLPSAEKASNTLPRILSPHPGTTAGQPVTS